MENVDREKNKLMENVRLPEDAAKEVYAEKENQALANGIMPVNAVTNIVPLEQNMVGGKNVLTQSMIDQANTRYIIKYDYDLNGATLTVSKGCVLDFQAGSLKNGTLVGQNTYIQAPLVQIFYTTLTLSGTYLSFDGYGRVEWYGCYPGQSNVDFKDAYEAIGKVFKAVKLQAGQYATNKGRIQMGQKLVGVYSHGAYAKKTEILIHFLTDLTGTEEKYGLAIGKIGGNENERTVGATLENVNITTSASNTLRINGYKGLLIGAVTRCTVRDCVIWQDSTQTILTSSELQNQVLNSNKNGIQSIDKANICIGLKGSAEQVVIDNCHTYGDIGIGFLAGSDYVGITNCLLAQSSYGVASVYMKTSPANLYFNNNSLCLGQYGIYVDNVPSDGPFNNLFNCNVSNCRIEQLRSSIKDLEGYVAGASIYIGKQKGVGPAVFDNIMLGETSNGVIIRNSSSGGNITFNNSSMFEEPGIKKAIYQFGSSDKSGTFPRVNLHYHHNSVIASADTIRILDDRIKLSAPVEQIKMGNGTINRFDHIVAYPYDPAMTAVAKEPIQGLRIVDDLVNLSPRKTSPTGEYYFLPEYNATNINESTYVGIIAEISYINGNDLERAKILFGKTGVTVLESTDGIIAHNSWASPLSNKLYVLYSPIDKFSYLENTFSSKINVRIKMECIYSDSNQY